MMHRGRWSQTNGWALWHHSSSTFLSSLRTSMDGFNTFSFFVVKSCFFAIHGWLTGCFTMTTIGAVFRQSFFFGYSTTMEELFKIPSFVVKLYFMDGKQGRLVE
ncbi:hypothetical protein [Neobacillus cucumis]|uniref:hypothetical protein n=1 Tax=Neobacillus cucumis TaxID=1740721 RepID=UPI0035F3FB8E